MTKMAQNRKKICGRNAMIRGADSLWLDVQGEIAWIKWVNVKI